MNAIVGKAAKLGITLPGRKIQSPMQNKQATFRFTSALHRSFLSPEWILTLFPGAYWQRKNPRSVVGEPSDGKRTAKLIKLPSALISTKLEAERQSPKWEPTTQRYLERAVSRLDASLRRVEFWSSAPTTRLGKNKPSRFAKLATKLNASTHQLPSKRYLT